MINTIKNPILITIIAALLHCVWTETGACRSLDDVYVPLACARGKCTGENRRHLRPLAMGERPSTAIMTMTPELAAFWREIKGKAQEIATLIRDAVHE
ncbi:MAG: hypothetical protein WCG78_05120, partial [Candidatus Omnitrophota bacterium]